MKLSQDYETRLNLVNLWQYNKNNKQTTKVMDNSNKKTADINEFILNFIDESKDIIVGQKITKI